MKQKIKLLFLACLFAFFSVNVNAQVWEPVGNPAGVSADAVGRLALKVDQQDNVIVGYYDASVQQGSVQKFNGTEWTYLGGSPGMTGGYAIYNSLCVDNQGTVYFTNQAGYPETGLQVRKFAGQIWESLPDATASTINYQASGVSSDGTLFVVTGENNGTVLRFVNGVWEQVGNTGFFGGSPLYLNMSISNNGIIYLSWNSNGNVHVYYNLVGASVSDEWQPVGGETNIAPASCSENYNSSLAVDNNNNLFIAYVSEESAGRKMNVKKFDGVSWSQVGEGNFTNYRVQHNSIAIGANNIVYVASSNWENDNFLRNYVMAFNESTNSWYQAGVGWATEGQATNNSLAVDSEGNLYLAFSDSNLGKLAVKKLNLEIVAAESVVINTEGGVAPEINIDGGSLQLVATVYPAQASQQVVWSIVSGGTQASIDANGLLTATTSNALVTVKATTAENASISSTFNVNITNQISPVQPDSIYVTTENNVNADILSLNETLKLVATISPLEADQYVTWSVTEGSEFLSIDGNGIVTPIGEGHAIIRATSNVDPTLFDEIRVNVWENGCTQFNESIMAGFGYGINNGYLGADDFVVGSETRFKVGTVRLTVFSDTLVEFTSFNLRFCKNDIGRPGEEVGNTSVVPTSQVYVSQVGMWYVYNVQLDLTEDIMLDQGIYWLNPTASTVDGNIVYWDATTLTGGIEGYGVSVDYNDGHGWRDGAGVNAVFEITGSCTTMPLVISTINGNDASVFMGESLQLEAVVNAQGLSQSVTWSIESGSNFASVNESGLVMGLSAGIATVKAVSVDDPDVFGVLEVEVHDPNECFQQVNSNYMENGYTFGGSISLAVDIDVNFGETFTMSSIQINTADLASSFTFNFYNDVNGFPGEEILLSTSGEIVDNRVVGYHDVFLIYFHQYTIELETPIKLFQGKYWMEVVSDATAWESTSVSSTGLAGAFKSPASENKWVYASNGIDYVYKVDGLCEPVGNFPSPNEVTYTYTDNTVNLFWQAPETQSGLNLIGYNIYKGLQLIGTTDANTLTFANPNSVNGTYSYGISAVYGDPEPGISIPSTVSVTISLNSSIAVNPNSFHVVINTPNGQTTKTMTIENNGEVPLTWNASIGYMSIKKSKEASGELMLNAFSNNNSSFDNDLTLSTKNPLRGLPELSVQHDVDGGQPVERDRDNAVLNYDGDNADAIGFTEGGSFYVAARFPASMTSAYTGFNLQSVDIYINDIPSESVLKVYGTGTANTPGALIHEQAFTGNAGSWVTIELSSPVVLDGGDIWIGYYVTHAAGEYPAGIDAGPANSNGDWISADGSSWGHLTEVAINSNWNIRANLSGSLFSWLTMQTISGEVTMGGNQQVELGFDASGLDEGVYEAVIHLSSNDPVAPVLDIPVTLDFSVGIEINELSNIEVYPNPATDFLRISVPDGVKQVIVYNSKGQVVKMENIENETVLNWNVQSFTRGFYQIRLTDSFGNSVSKSIIIM